MKPISGGQEELPNGSSFCCSIRSAHRTTFLCVEEPSMKTPTNTPSVLLVVLEVQRGKKEGGDE